MNMLTRWAPSETAYKYYAAVKRALRPSSNISRYLKRITSDYIYFIILKGGELRLKKILNEHRSFLSRASVNFTDLLGFFQRGVVICPEGNEFLIRWNFNLTIE